MFTSFTLDQNQRLFGGPLTTQDRLIAALVELVGQPKVDGINVDVEQLDPDLVAAYGDFVARLRVAATAAHPKAQVSVATTANLGGAAMAVAANAAGADRIFLMGYDYHWSGSAPGASSPILRRDGDPKSLTWSLDLYESLGVPGPADPARAAVLRDGLAGRRAGGRRAADRQGHRLDPERPPRPPAQSGDRADP